MKRKKYTLTTAQANARPHKGFKDTLDFFNETTNSEMQYCPTIGMNSSEKDTLMHFNLNNGEFLYDNKSYNDNIKYEPRYVRPQAIDPVSGLAHIVGQGKSVIIGHPQIRVKHFASDEAHKYPRAVISTGAITVPNYSDKDTRYAERRRLGRIAKDHHTYGAMLLGISGSKRFHFRHVRADSKGRFVDLGTLYEGNKDPQTVDTKCLIVPDYHNGANEQHVVDAVKGMVDEYAPLNIVLHDFLNMHSVNPHGDHELIYQRMIHTHDVGNHNLERELEEGYNELVELSEMAPQATIYVVDCNHHRFLNRWLDEGKFVKDVGNARLGFKLATAYASGKNPVLEGLRHVGGKIPKNIKFTKSSQSVRIGGIEVNKHGDQGIFNKRASIKQMEQIHRKIIYGHCHTGEQYHDIYSVGTMTPRYPFYGKGAPSNSTHTVGMIDWLNKPQFVNIMDGKYKLR